MYVCLSCLSGIGLIIPCSQFPLSVMYLDHTHTAAAFGAKFERSLSYRSSWESESSKG